MMKRSGQFIFIREKNYFESIFIKENGFLPKKKISSSLKSKNICALKLLATK
jgi:hypothetical protein